MKYIFYTLVFCNISLLVASQPPLNRSAITNIISPIQNLYPNSEMYAIHFSNGDRMVYRLNGDGTLVAHLTSNETTREIAANKADFSYVKQQHLDYQKKLLESLQNNDN